MTREEAKAEQDRLQAEGWDLSHWYGTKCDKCCGVYPKTMIAQTFDPHDVFYQCPVCGKKTKRYTMPWLAVEAWNSGEYDPEQMNIYQFLEGNESRTT